MVDVRVRVVYYFFSMESKSETPPRYEDIDTLVERYRIRLGLKPWEEWVEYINAILLKQTGKSNTQHRRTGRTQFGILRAIALCEQRGAVVLAVSADPPPNRSYCINMAENSIAGLGLDIRVTPDYPGCSEGDLAVLYTDHHIHVRSR